MKYYNISQLAHTFSRAYFLRLIRQKGFYAPTSNIKIQPRGAWYSLKQLKTLDENYKKATAKTYFRFYNTGDQILAKRLKELINAIENGEDIFKKFGIRSLEFLENNIKGAKNDND